MTLTNKQKFWGGVFFTLIFFFQLAEHLPKYLRLEWIVLAITVIGYLDYKIFWLFKSKK